MKNTLAPCLPPSIPTVNKHTSNPKRLWFSDPDLTACFRDSTYSHIRKVSAVALIYRLRHPGCRIYIYYPVVQRKHFTICNTRLNVSCSHPKDHGSAWNSEDSDDHA